MSPRELTTLAQRCSTTPPCVRPGLPKVRIIIKNNISSSSLSPKVRECFSNTPSHIALSSWGVCNFTGRGQQRPYTRSPAARPHCHLGASATSLGEGNKGRTPDPPQQDPADIKRATTSSPSASSLSGWVLRELVRCLVHPFPSPTRIIIVIINIIIVIIIEGQRMF